MFYFFVSCSCRSLDLIWLWQDFSAIPVFRSCYLFPLNISPLIRSAFLCAFDCTAHTSCSIAYFPAFTVTSVLCCHSSLFILPGSYPLARLHFTLSDSIPPSRFNSIRFPSIPFDSRTNPLTLPLPPPIPSPILPSLAVVLSDLPSRYQLLAFHDQSADFSFRGLLYGF
ncbi:hypothetical protein DFH29DRAFT_492482 [Suillus ampliporus]|nr:hypothetical protein DFH29DRAFT_492482 [Suillus ampliporus]